MLELYSNIRKRREELGLTQSQLADLAGYADKTMISKIEKGAVDLAQSKIVLIASALQTTPRVLMGWEDPAADLSVSPAPGIQRTLSPDEAALIDDYQKLNSRGKDKVREYAEDLSEQDKYREDTGLSEGVAG